jgi:hypothetical protein
VGGRELADDRSDPGQKAGRDQDRIPAQPDLIRSIGRGRLGRPPLAAAYQVTSPAPVRTFATRASMKRRSDSRLR